jgi:hypothetical protein
MAIEPGAPPIRSFLWLIDVGRTKVVHVVGLLSEGTRAVSAESACFKQAARARLPARLYRPRYRRRPLGRRSFLALRFKSI